MTEQGESVDFDFFESPRSPSRNEEVTTVPVRDKTNLKTENRDKSERQKSPSPRRSSRSVTPDYSSDSPVSDSESESTKQQEVKNKRRLSHSSTGSSVSSRSESVSSRSYSRSRSSSRSENDRGSKSKQSGKGNGQMPKKSKSRQEEDDYSSSAYSDGENGKSMDSYDNVPTPLRKNSKRQAWGDSQNKGERKDTNRNTKARPMTAKTRTHQNQQARNKSRSDSDSEALSDSDITDVSPMESPRTQDKSKSGHGDVMGAAGDGNPMRVQYKAMPVSHEDLKEDGEDCNVPRGGLDLEILMKAVGELEKQKRVEANTRRVMFAPMTLKRNEKANYTFDRYKTRDIERENERLLKEIVRRVNAGDQQKQYRRSQPPTNRMTPSAVNREKEMRRIESENMAILRRLQKVKPTQTISRNNQIKAYENTKLHGIPIAAVHPLPRTGKRSASRTDDSVSSIGSRTRSLTSLHSVSSSVRSSGSRRSSRPSSATKRIDTRPEWSDRW